MKFGLVSSKYFAMGEFSDANQSSKYFSEAKKSMHSEMLLISCLSKMHTILEKYV